eukprot:scaffold23151_cov117-Isochrysis_galbana.AAC.10
MNLGAARQNQNVSVPRVLARESSQRRVGHQLAVRPAIGLGQLLGASLVPGCARSPLQKMSDEKARQDFGVPCDRASDRAQCCALGHMVRT